MALPTRLLTQRLRAELAAFGVVGAICLAGDIVLFNVFAFEVGMPPLLAKSVGMVITGTVAFIGHRQVTFRHRHGGGFSREIPLFTLVTIATVLFSLLPLFAARHVFDVTGVFWLNVANLLGIGLGTVARYLSYRDVVWKHAPAAPAGSDDRLSLVDDRLASHEVRRPGPLEMQHELVGEERRP